MAALKGRFDPFVGRKLHAYFHQAGLEDLRVHALPHHLIAGRPSPVLLDNWRVKLATLAPVGEQVLGAAEYGALRRDFLGFLEDPGSMTYSVLFMLEGTRT